MQPRPPTARRHSEEANCAQALRRIGGRFERRRSKLAVLVGPCMEFGGGDRFANSRLSAMSRTWRCVVGSAVAVAGAALLGYAAPPFERRRRAGVRVGPRGPRSILRHLPQPAPADGRARPRRDGPRPRRRPRRRVGAGRQEAAHGGDAAGGPAAPRAGRLRRRRLDPRDGPRPRRRRRPQSGPHHRPPTEPAGVRQRGTRPPDARESTPRPCCRPTTRTSASTTWPTSSRCRRPCSTATSSRRGASADSPSATPASSRRPRPGSCPRCGSRTAA